MSERSSGTSPAARTRLRYFLYRYATWITTNSVHQADALARRLPNRREAIRAIWNGVDLEKFRPNHDLGQTKRTDATPRLLAVGTVVPIKNLSGLISALALLRDRGQEVRVTWVGKTTAAAESVAARREAEALLTAHELDANWTWHGETSSMAELYRNHDALVHPSLVEGMPNVVCEALASGLPILASAVSDIPRLVPKGTGLLFDPQNTTEIADAIGRFIALPDEDVAQMRRSCRTFAENRLSLDRYVEEYAGLIETR